MYVCVYIKGYLMGSLSGDGAQTRLHWHKINFGLLQHPCFNLDVPHAQQVQRTANIVCFPHALRLMTLDLCGYTGRHFNPFAQAGKGTAQAVRRNRPILAFVYDPTQPERGKLRWALDNFLQNRRTRDIMNEAFVTALVPLAAIAAISEILKQQSMEESRWVVLDQLLRPLEQDVIYANAQEAEGVVGRLAKHYAADSGRST
jgi:hypothetical protein